MKFKFENWEEAADALIEGDVEAANVADADSARHLRVAMADRLAQLPENPTIGQLEHGQWLHGEIQTLDCDYGS